MKIHQYLSVYAYAFLCHNACKLKTNGDHVKNCRPIKHEDEVRRALDFISKGLVQPDYLEIKDAPGKGE